MKWCIQELGAVYDSRAESAMSTLWATPSKYLRGSLLIKYAACISAKFVNGLQLHGIIETESFNVIVTIIAVIIIITSSFSVLSSSLVYAAQLESRAGYFLSNKRTV